MAALAAGTPFPKIDLARLGGGTVTLGDPQGGRDWQLVDVSNAPFLRPDLDKVLGGITFIRANDYPIRGTHQTA